MSFCMARQEELPRLTGPARRRRAASTRRRVAHEAGVIARAKRRLIMENILTLAGLALTAAFSFSLALVLGWMALAGLLRLLPCGARQVENAEPARAVATIPLAAARPPRRGWGGGGGGGGGPGNTF